MVTQRCSEWEQHAGNAEQALKTAKPGGAGHALLFADHAVTLKGIKVGRNALSKEGPWTMGTWL